MAEVAAKSHAEARYPAAATIQRITDLFASTNARLQACAAAVPRPTGSHVSLGPWPFHTSAPPTVTGTAVLPPAGPGAPTPSAPAPAAATPETPTGTNAAAGAGVTAAGRATGAAAPSLGGIARSGAVAVLAAAACLLL